MGLFVILAAPRLYRSIRTGRMWQSIGFWEKTGGYEPLEEKINQEGIPKPLSTLDKAVGGARALVHGPTLFSIPKTQVDLGERTWFIPINFFFWLISLSLSTSPHHCDLLWDTDSVSPCTVRASDKFQSRW